MKVADFEISFPWWSVATPVRSLTATSTEERYFMNSTHLRLAKPKALLIIALTALFAVSCFSDGGGKTADDDQMLAVEEVKIGSLDDLMALMDKLNYNKESWDKGNREVPRIIFEDVSEEWKKTSSEIPVVQKKQIFFRLMAPLVLMANENILREREFIAKSPLGEPRLLELAKKYKVADKDATSVEEAQRKELLQRADGLSPSLVLAQAAEESGWASSRFTIEGNAFFGQWDFSGKGMVPGEQRKELGNYGLARFDTPLASVEGYMLNINTHGAYEKLRKLRAELRDKARKVTGIELAGTLDKYSERGQAYVDGIREMISYNKLEPVDDAYLSGGSIYKLVAKK